MSLDHHNLPRTRLASGHFVRIPRRVIHIGTLSRGAFAVVHALRSAMAESGGAPTPGAVVAELENAVGTGKGMRLLGAIGALWWALGEHSRAPLTPESPLGETLSAREERLIRVISVAIAGTDPHLQAYLDYMLKGLDTGRIIGAARHAALILATAREPWFELGHHPASLADL
jgi:hypothetical protein